MVSTFLAWSLGKMHDSVMWRKMTWKVFVTIDISTEEWKMLTKVVINQIYAKPKAIAKIKQRRQMGWICYQGSPEKKIQQYFLR